MKKLWIGLALFGAVLVVGSVHGQDLNTKLVNLLNGSITQSWLFAPDNTFDIGATGATRPRDLFLARNATIGGSVLSNLTFSTDSTLDIGATGATRPRSLYLGGSAITAGTDSAAVDSGEVRRVVYKSSVTPAPGVDCAAAFKAAALTADCTVATLPAKTRLVGVYADVTAGFTCSGTCTGTKVMQAGTAAAGTQILAAGLNVAVTGQFGLADADLGSGLTRAARIQDALTPSWTTTTPVSVRFTSGTGNWGNASATFVNAGSVTFYLVTEVLP